MREFRRDDAVRYVGDGVGSAIAIGTVGRVVTAPSQDQVMVEWPGEGVCVMWPHDLEAVEGAE